jgi:hypothetical protein
MYGFEDEKGDGLETTSDDFHQVPLITLDGSEFPHAHPKVSAFQHFVFER